MYITYLVVVVVVNSALKSYVTYQIYAKIGKEEENYYRKNQRFTHI